jgi:hypothetical protein
MRDAHVKQRQNVFSTREVQHIGLYTVFNVQPPKG